MEQDQTIEERYDHVQLVQPSVPIQSVFYTDGAGTSKFTCRKCGSLLHMRTDVGHVCSWLDRVLRCPYCSYNNQIYPENYRR
jgi:hypothetical protein